MILDFETEAIEPQGGPPKPVGFAYIAGREKGYVSWGHPGANSHTREGAVAKLLQLTGDNKDVVCHNAQFDCGVYEKHIGADSNSWNCTMAMAFLSDPYQGLALKPLAEKHLSMPPEEQDRLTDWIVKNVPKATRKTAGAYISKAPVELVAPYAIGDVVRTKGLYDKWKASVSATSAYQREMALLPTILDMEDHGVKINNEKLFHDVQMGYKRLDQLDSWLIKKLGSGVDIDGDASVAQALTSKGLLKEPLLLTETGQSSISKDSLIQSVADPQLLGRLLLRSSLATSLRNFMGPWNEASATKGRLMFRFSPIRSDYGVGARTGRLSCSPSLMNVPSMWELLMATFKDIGFKPGFALENVRQYIEPDKDHVMISADYSQIEMRVFAHYEDGALLNAYQNNANIDAHTMVAELAGVTRKVAKTLNFAALYGAGLAVIMLQLGCTYEEARMFKGQYASAFPGVKELNDAIKADLKTVGHITTIGGRRYACEEPKYVKGRIRTFEYKLINYLCQGGAADIMKEAMIAYHKHPHRHGRLMFTVHDQMIVSCPRSRVKAEINIISKCMTEALADQLDVPLAVNIEVGNNYAEV